jgi:hypothetical protein
MDFTDVTRLVREAQLGVGRITDVAPGDYNLDILNSSDPKVEARIIFRNAATKKKYGITATGLANARIVPTADVAKKATTTAQARETEGYDNLQSALEKDGTKSLSKDMKFTVVHNLHIMDREDPTKHVYKNEAYSGYKAYLKEADKVRRMPTGDDKTAEWARIGDALRATPIVEANNKPEFYLTMPVFVIS